MEHSAVTRRKCVDAALPLLPRGGGAEQIAVPGLIEQRFAVVIPRSVDHSGGAELLSVAHEALDVDEGDRIVGVDTIPAAYAGSDPRLHSHIAKGSDQSKVRRIYAVGPRHGDQIFRDSVHQLR